MTEKIRQGNENYQHNKELKIKVIIGHILIAKVFLDPYFEKYYIHFLKDDTFDHKNFQKSIAYIDTMLYGENYQERYAQFENNIPTIIHLLMSSEDISQSIKESMIGDITYILGKTNKNGDVIPAEYDLDFLDNHAQIKMIKASIHRYIENQQQLLISALCSLQMNKIKSDLVKKIKEIME